MAAQIIQNPLMQLAGLNGQALANGYVYLGEPNTDPIANPKAVYWDEGLTIPAQQPLRTNAGYITRNGAPARIWVDGDYSILVNDAQGRQIFYIPFWSYNSASNVTFTQDVPGAPSMTVQEKLRQVKNLLDFPGGTFTARILAAAVWLNTTGGEVQVNAGNYTMTGGTTVEIDVGKGKLVALGCAYVDCSGFTGANVMQVYSSLAYPQGHLRNGANGVEGFVFQGNKTAGRHGLLVGHAVNANNGQTVLRGCAFSNFDRAHHFTDNAWRPAFYHCTFHDSLSHTLYYPAGLTNSGEVMHYDHCMLVDGPGTVAIAGANAQFNFYATSVLNQPIVITGTANKVAFFGGNIENPGNPVAYTYASVNGSDNLLVFDSTSLVLNNGATFNDSPFDCGVTCTILFDNMFFPNGPHLAFEVIQGYRTWVKGSGTGVARNARFLQAVPQFQPCISWWGMNEISNPGFEAGTTAGWTVAAYGTAGSTGVANAAAAKNGGFGLLITTVATGGINVSQTKSCRPGQAVFVGGWAKVQSSGGAPCGYLQLIFFDIAGNVISSPSEEIVGATWTWYGSSLARVAPMGTATVSLICNGQASAGINVLYFDDLILNVS